MNQIMFDENAMNLLMSSGNGDVNFFPGRFPLKSHQKPVNSFQVS